VTLKHRWKKPILRVNNTMRDLHLYSIATIFLSFCSITPSRAQWIQPYFPIATEVVVLSFASIDSNFFAATSNDGIFLSKDSGITWSATPDSGLNCTYVYSLAKIGTSLFAGTDTGVFRSIDKSKTWSAVNTGLPGTRIYALAANGTNLFAASQTIRAGHAGDDLFISKDSGVSWTLTGTPFPDTFSIYTLSSNGSEFLAGGDMGAFLTTDNGTTWTPLGLSNVISIAAKGSILVMGTFGGVEVLDDNGDRWFSDGLIKEDVYSLALSGTNIFAGTYPDGVFLSTDSGASWKACGLASDTLVYNFAITGADLFAGTDLGIWRRPLSVMINTSAVAPTRFSIQSISSYPNPCSQSATITFSSTSSVDGEVTILNLLGVEVARIFSGELSAGEHSFTWDASGMAAGIYFCKVRFDGKLDQIPVMLEK
jgi:photosystem II stability/assembly factor-like uncharacterized protein